MVYLRWKRQKWNARSVTGVKIGVDGEMARVKRHLIYLAIINVSMVRQGEL